MAAPVQTVNCEQKTSSEIQDQQISSGNTGLKNGANMEEVSSEEVPGNLLINSKVKSPNQSRDVTMENFQDGGPQHQLSMNAEQSGTFSSMDGPRINSDMNNYSQNSGDQTVSSDDYGKMNDSLNQGQLQGYGGGYNNRANYISEQHGGPQIPGNSDMPPNSQQNNPYSPYNQQNVRPSYAQPSKTMTMGPPRPPNSASNMNMMPGYGTSPNQQRFLSGHSLTQQGGPTPTLNQLLQSPNPVHRYHNNYNDYSMAQTLQKSPADIGNTPQYPSAQNWGTSRGMNTYSQQIGSPGYRNQGGAIDPSQQAPMKRPGQSPYISSGPNYPSHQTSQQGQGQYGPQFSQRYPSPQGPQGRPPQLAIGHQNYVQQLPSHYNQQHGPPQQHMSNYEQRPTQVFIQQQSPQSFQGNRPQSTTGPSTKEGSDLSEMSSNVDETPPEPSQGTPTPPVAHPSVSALRPTPSPSGSSGSRSMSPAIITGTQQNIPMPPRPSSQSDSNQGRMSHSPMAAQGYSQPMAPPHMAPPMYGNKIHPSMMGGSQQLGPYSPQNQQYQQGNYPRNSGSMGMQGYGNQPQTYPGSQPNSMGQPFGMNRIGNHMPSQGYGGQYSHSMNSQFSSQSYGMSPSTGGAMLNSMSGQTQPLSQGPPSHLNNSMMPPNQMMNKGPVPSGAQVAAQAAVMAAATSAGGSRSPIYMKHQVQQKMYSSQMNYNSGPPGPGQGPGIPGPQSGSGPMPSSRDSPGMPVPPTMPPPAIPSAPSTPTPSSTPTPTQTPQPLTPGQPPPASTPSTTPTPPSLSSAMSIAQPPENSEGNTEQRTTPVPSSAAGSSLPGGNSITSSSVESVIPIQDEASQQSTASNTSNTDERAETPRPRKDIPHSHPPTPASTLPSPGAASMSSFHDEFESVSSPSWPRTPASPVVNSQVHEYHPPPTIKRSDNLNKLYDISDDPERRAFLDRLVAFNDERGTAITQCPTISKQPLDLFKLYLVVKDRAGFVEVTKAKHWKDVAGQIGIGASSSAAYTLRKQYVKHLLPYECKFDRGGIDPQPIINQLEASTRKKSSSKVNATPSPGRTSTLAGSSNSQDSFPASNSQSMDGFPTPPGPYSQYNQGPTSNPEYPGQMMNAPPGNIPGGDPSHAGLMANHNESISLQNPFADELQGHQFSRGGNIPTGLPPPTLQNSYGYGNSGTVQQRPQGMPTMPPPYTGSQPIAGPTPPPGPFPYNEQINRSGSVASQPEQFTGDQFRRTQIMNHENFNSRTSEPYSSTGSGYPTNRMQNTPPQYSYGPQYDRERYEQQQGSMIPSGQQIRPPSQSGVIQQHSGDAAGYPPPQHRYGGQQLGSREPSVYPPRTYSGPPPPPPPAQGQQPGYGNSTDQFRQDQTFPMSSPNQTADSSQAHLTPDSPKKSQCYSANQQGIYSPSSKMMPPQGFTQGPKRHPDFMKPAEQQFNSGTNFTQGQPTQQQPPYSGWRNDSQYSSYSGQTPSAPPTAQTQMGPQREDWSSRDQTGQWPPIHQRYPPQGPGHYNQSGNMPPHLAQNLPPQNLGPNASLRHMMVQRMPHGFKDKPQAPFAMQPSKVQPMPSIAPNAQYPPKREIIFPPDSVEAVTPVLVKRKRMQSRDVTPVEAWRLMMALKSGLLCESSWALDVLSVLLFDDNTVLYFSLQHLPGLLEVLMEHYRRCLVEAYGISEELEIGFHSPKHPETDVAADMQWFKIKESTSDKEVDVDLGAIKNIDLKDRVTIMEGENYTMKSHHGKLVKIVNKNDIFISDSDRNWDTYEGFSGSTEHWQLGGGDSTIHVQTHFESEKTCVKFVRILEQKCKNEPTENTEYPQENKTVLNKVLEENNLAALSDSKERTPQNKTRLVNKIVKTEPVDECTNSCSEESLSKQSACLPCKTEIKTETLCDQEEEVSKDTVTAKPAEQPPVPADLYRRRPKKRCMEDYEDEAYNRDEPSLALIDDGQDSLMRRCICISNILRSLSFVPGNDSEMSKHPGFLLVMGKLLLLHHNHALRRQNNRNYDKEEDGDFSDSCSSLHDREWWWDGLHILRENTLVTLSNIAGQLDLSLYPEEISLPILDGLLHWSVCPAAYAQDPLPNLPAYSVLSPQRLTLEALCKLSVQDNNVDLILATPPFSRIEKLFGFLSRSLSKHEDAVVREFSIVLLHYFSQAESGAARVIACQSSSVSLLIAFIEQTEQSALTIANSHGINMLRENPEMMGTSLDMLRRAANTLLALARVPENRPLFLQHQQRLLNLVMSQILDQHVAAILAEVLFECSQPADVLS